VEEALRAILGGIDMTEPIGTSPLVLMVDDDPGTRMLAAASLKKAGYSTVEASDGEGGVAAWDRFRPDLILMDAVMPGMDGFAAIREIRKRPGGERVPVLMMTGLDDLASIHRAYEAGATDFTTKPMNWVVLGYRVGYLLHASRAFLDLAGSEEKTRALLRAIPDLIFRIARMEPSSIWWRARSTGGSLRIATGRGRRSPK